MARARDRQFDAVLAEAIDGMVHPTRRGDPVLHAIQRRMGHTIGVDGFVRQMEAIIGRPDSRPELAKIASRTLVLVGEEDPLTPKDRAEEIANAVPGAKLVVVPHAGHATTLEQPEAVNRALIDWISG